MSGPASVAIATLISSGESLCICFQVIAEFWNVATRPAQFNGLGWTSERAESAVIGMRSAFPLVADSPEILDAWQDLVVRHLVFGAKVHDAKLVALMKVHQIDRLLTFNIADFVRYDIEAVHPQSILNQL